MQMFQTGFIIPCLINEGVSPVRGINPPGCLIRVHHWLVCRFGQAISGRLKPPCYGRSSSKMHKIVSLVRMSTGFDPKGFEGCGKSPRVKKVHQMFQSKIYVLGVCCLRGGTST